MELARAFGDGPDYYLPVIAGACAALAAASVVCAFWWCRRIFGLAGAIVGALVVATAPDLVFFGARTLNEVVAGHLLIIALFLIEPATEELSRRRLYVGGLLLGLAFVLRIQPAPAILLIALWNDRRRVPTVLAGACLAVLLCGALDWAMLGFPFASIWRYFIYNTFYGVSDFFGVKPWTYYGGYAFDLWSWELFVLAGLALVGAWRKPFLFVVAAVIIAAHCLVGHKEYRFIYPAVLLLIVLAGIGLAQLAEWIAAALIGRGVRASVARPLCCAAAAAYWCAISLLIWNGPAYTILRAVGRDQFAAAAFVGRDPTVCGVGVFVGLGGNNWIYSNFTRLHRPVPRYWPKDRAALAGAASSFNTLIYAGAAPDPRFKTSQCIGDICIARRAGGCDGAPMGGMPVPAPLR
jgi:GPI mannosyltransferase 3